MAKTVKLVRIVVDPEIQQRADGIDEDIVTEYVDAYIEGSTLPPVVAFDDGKKLWLADGFHRFEAKLRTAEESIRCTVHKGTRRDAILYACQANRDHGKRRTNADKRKAVLTLIELYPTRSARWIAEKAAVDHELADRIKKQVADSATSQPGELIQPPYDCPSIAERGRIESELLDNVDLIRTPAEDVAEQIDAQVDDVEFVQASLITRSTVGKDGKTYPPKKPHVANNSGDNEWYTPLEIIAAARAVLVSIDLDPASSDEAQEVIQAGTYYTAKDDGLSKEWTGNVYMNPPYAKDLIGEFIGMLHQHIDSGDVPAAIVLVNNSTETKWGQSMLSKCDAACFPAGRVKYWAPGKESTPLQGQLIVYYGRAIRRFEKHFSKIGAVLTRNK